MATILVMRTLRVPIICLVASLSAIKVGEGQVSNPAPANDNPLSGLNLGDTPGATTSGSNSSDAISIPSAFVERFKGHLFVMDGGTVKEFDASTLKDVKYWAFYHSAGWCPPCRTFTPKLVDFYKYFKKTHPNFELVFVSGDKTEADMLEDMQDDDMPWPSLKYSDRRLPNVRLQKYFGPGIPDLVLVDGNGKVLSDTFDETRTKNLDPNNVIDDIKKMVPSPTD